MKDTANVCCTKKSQPPALVVGTGDGATRGVGPESKYDKKQREGASLTLENVEGGGSIDDELSGAHTPARDSGQGARFSRHDPIQDNFPMMNEAASDVAHSDRFELEDKVEAETAASERGRGVAVSMMSAVKQDDEWRLGEVYPLIEESLFFTAHPDDTYTLKVISMNPGAFFFSNDLPGRSHLSRLLPLLPLLPLFARIENRTTLECARPHGCRPHGCRPQACLVSHAERYNSFCQDFGPTNIALIMAFCR